MAKEKLTLDELKVQSFATTLSDEQMTNTKGGLYTIKGRNYNYNVRWTAIDIRLGHIDELKNGSGK
jgi:hypothetical protein